jgi:hypothetical protein
MKSFKEFLEERKVDPVKLAQRVARRYGKKTNYPGYKDAPDTDYEGEEWKPRVGTHIPLRSYKHMRRDEYGSTALNRAYEKRKVTPEKGKSFSIKDLHPTQPFVRTTDAGKLRKKISGTFGGTIHIATYKGKHYIMNGHHEVMGAAMRGEKSITATHHNLD